MSAWQRRESCAAALLAAATRAHAKGDRRAALAAEAASLVRRASIAGARRARDPHSSALHMRAELCAMREALDALTAAVDALDALTAGGAS